MRRLLVECLLVAVAVGTAGGLSVVRAQGQVQTKKDIVYAVHDGTSLLGDLYLPAGPGPHPAMMYIHGGGLIGGSKSAYARTWGPYLAARGYAVFAIDYRVGKPEKSSWPGALLDCKAALQYLRGNAAALGIDPDRIGVGGDSAGGLLSALVGVTQDWPTFTNKYPNDPYTSVSTRVKLAAPMYGIFDAMISEKHSHFRDPVPPYPLALGGIAYSEPGEYFEASAIAYVHEAAKSLGKAATPNLASDIPWFVAWGMVDPRVPPISSSIPFVKALREAGATVTDVPVPNVGHFWFTASAITGQQGEPVCTETGTAPDFRYVCKGATPNDFVEPKLLDFLARNLSPTLQSSVQK